MEKSHVGILAECSYPLPITRYLIIKLVEIYHFPEIETIGAPLQTYLYRDEPSNHSKTSMCCSSSGLDGSLLSTLKEGSHFLTRKFFSTHHCPFPVCSTFSQCHNCFLVLIPCLHSRSVLSFF